MTQIKGIVESATTAFGRRAALAQAQRHGAPAGSTAEVLLYSVEGLLDRLVRHAVGHPDMVLAAWPNGTSRSQCDLGRVISSCRVSLALRY